MRKIGIGLIILAIIGTIALVVRSQMPESEPVVESRAPIVAERTPAAPKPAPVIQPVAREMVPRPDTTRRARPVNAPPVIAPPVIARPVISDKVPSIVEADEPQDGAAVLKKASAAYRNVKSMRADFVQRRENVLIGSTTTSRGRLYQRRPDRFALKFTEPAGDVIVGDGRYFWLYYPSVDRKQVMRAPASAEAAGAVDLQAQFIGDPLKKFKHTYQGTQPVGGRSAHVLTLVPRDADAGYKSLKVWIDTRDSLVRRFQITEPTGALVEFQLSNLAVNPTLGDETFRFTPPAGARIIER